MERFLIKVKSASAVEVQENEIDESEREGNEDDVKRKRLFRVQWKDIFPWVDNKGGQAFCVLCNKALTNISSHLSRHEEKPINIKNATEKKHQISITDFCTQTSKEKSFKKLVQDAEIKLVLFCLLHNLPLSLMDYLPKALKCCFPDSTIASAIQCGKTKSTNITKSLAVERKNVIAKFLQTTSFSIIVDETTDISTEKSLAVVARVYDSTQKRVRDLFLGLIRLENTDAGSIYDKLVSFFFDLNVPIGNIIGLATDGASVMSGHLTGLQARLRNTNPSLFYMRCICHSLHICASNACRKLPVSVEKLSRNIYNFFCHSLKRVNEFREFQDYFSLKPHKILCPSQTRWLSVEQVVNRILEQWSALKLYFISCNFEEKLLSAKELAQELDKSSNKVYFLFLSYILKIVNQMNKEFQSERVRVHRLYKIMEQNLLVILSNFMKTDYIKGLSCLSEVNPNDSCYHLDIDIMFIGLEAEQELKKSGSSAADVKLRILEFYIELTNQILKRFDFKNEVFKKLSILNPETVCSTKESILPLIDSFPNIVSNREAIFNEWRMLCFQKNINFNEDIEIFWQNLSIQRDAYGKPAFENLCNFVLCILSLPHSSAAAERVFSQLNLLKNKKSNRFMLTTIDSIMLAKELESVYFA